mmetsp:Transcript_6030/g.14720  ORF Transcript_6030/g.14720 Transcript_6030/m.14720 type:complete len:239 (-) Transcript_6030:815-1531(-)
MATGYAALSSKKAFSSVTLSTSAARRSSRAFAASSVRVTLAVLAAALALLRATSDAFASASTMASSAGGTRGAGSSPSGHVAFLSHATGTTRWCASTPGPLCTISRSTLGIRAPRGAPRGAAPPPPRKWLVFAAPGASSETDSDSSSISRDSGSFASPGCPRVTLPPAPSAPAAKCVSPPSSSTARNVSICPEASAASSAAGTLTPTGGAAPPRMTSPLAAAEKCTAGGGGAPGCSAT